MTDTARRYVFNTVFSSTGEVLRDGDRVKNILTADEAETLRAAAYEEGRQAEETIAAHTQAEAVRAVASQMQLILARLHGESEALRDAAARLALVSARKIAGAALDAFAAETVEALAREAMGELRGDPRFSVHCAPALAGPLAEILEAAALEAGFEGAVTVRGEDGLARADCRLEWARGAIEHSAADVEARIEDLVTRWLAAADQPADDDADEANSARRSG